MKDNRIFIFVYYEYGEKVGYSIIVEQKEINNLYAWYGGVHPKYQNRGINRKFLEELIQFAKEGNYNSITLAS